MTVQECYAVMGGDYARVMGLLMTEDRVKKFLLMFLRDPNFEALCTAMAQQDWQTAFRSAHTLKGVCQNLCLDRLGKSTHDITEALRGLRNDGADALLPQVVSDYTVTVDAIKQL